MALVSLYNRVANRQTDAMSIVLGCEVGVEDPLTNLCRDTLTLVGDRDFHIRAAVEGYLVTIDKGDVAGRDMQGARVGGRLVGVEHKILDDLTNLVAIDVNVCQIGAEIKYCFQIRPAQRIPGRVPGNLLNRCLLA